MIRFSIVFLSFPLWSAIVTSDVFRQDVFFFVAVVVVFVVVVVVDDTVVIVADGVQLLFLASNVFQALISASY